MTTETEIAQRGEKQPNLLCFVEQFPLALQAVARVHDYARGGLAKGDYRPSLLRHLFGIGAHDDNEAAVAWNALAALELRERARVAAAEKAGQDWYFAKPAKEFPNGRPKAPERLRELTGVDFSRGSY